MYLRSPKWAYWSSQISRTFWAMGRIKTGFPKILKKWTWILRFSKPKSDFCRSKIEEKVKIFWISIFWRLASRLRLKVRPLDRGEKNEYNGLWYSSLFLPGRSLEMFSWFSETFKPSKHFSDSWKFIPNISETDTRIAQKIIPPGSSVRHLSAGMIGFSKFVEWRAVPDDIP